MSVVTIAEAWPAAGRPFTVAGWLYGVLSSVCPEDLCFVPEPAVMLGPQTEFDPDLVVVRMDPRRS